MAYTPTTIVATGGTAPYVFSNASLPAGLSISSSGVVSGTPTAFTATGSPFSGSVTITDNTGLQFTYALSISVIPGVLSVGNTSLPAGLINNSYTATLGAVQGTSPYTWSITSGTLPAGLSLNATTGAITGTPTVSGTFMITVKATDSALPTAQTATKALSLYVAPTLVISSSFPPTGTTIGSTIPPTPLVMEARRPINAPMSGASPWELRSTQAPARSPEPFKPRVVM